MSTRLRNGRFADPRQVVIVKGILARLFGGSRGNEGLGAVEWLVRYARNRTPETLTAIPPRYMDLLRYEGLVNSLTDIDGLVLDIVDACVDGNGFDMILVSPEGSAQAMPWSQQTFRVVDDRGEAVRVSVDRIADWLGFAPERRESFLSDPVLTQEECRVAAAEVAAMILVDPVLVEVKERPVLFGIGGSRFMSVVVELGAKRGDMAMRLVVGSAREAA